MTNFSEFKTAVDRQMTLMSGHELFRTDVDKDELWQAYLESFPPDSNPIFRERTEHDCQCCKQFIRSAGNMVAIIDGQLVSIWDVEEVDEPYQTVAGNMASVVTSWPIANVFRHFEKHLGTDHNHQLLENGETLRWNHFHYELPNKFVDRDPGPYLSGTRSNKEVFKRSLDEISLEAIETVLELIEQSSIYRGEEHLSIVELLLDCKVTYTDLRESLKDIYCWELSVTLGGAAKIRNTVIGTLLVDISEGVPLDTAVKSFETKVAPTNYKRPTALITKAMIDKAQAKVKELGIEDSLHRRYAVAEDLTINNVLFADRSVKKSMNVFDELAEEVPDKIGNLDKVDEVDLDTFINSILPKAESIELMVENKHTNNLVSLIAPTDAATKRIFKWDNNFSWAYNGGVTDSIKERVKSAGGNVEGVLRCSLSWFNYDDLDIHVEEPNQNHISYRTRGKIHSSSGMLDVDMNANGGNTREAVENIVWTDRSRMRTGAYRVWINNYNQRETVDVGFDVEIEFDGVTSSFHYNKRVANEQNVEVAIFMYTHENGIRFIESLPSTQASKEVWGITTHKFHKVNLVMNSPNHWDGEKIGNKHLFFILDKCKNDKSARGFFNEFLKEDLREYRKVFEVLGSKMKTEKSDHQLSGLGFSSTQRNQIVCRVKGSFTRTIKVNL